MFNLSPDVQSYIILIILFTVGYFSKNDAVQIAAITILVLKLLPSGDKYIHVASKFGINIGIIILTIGVFASIGLNKVSLDHLKSALVSPNAYIAIIIGVFATVLATKGVDLMATKVELTTYIIVGTIIGVGLFKGTAVGPLIASGMLAFVYMIIDKFKP